MKILDILRKFLFYICVLSLSFCNENPKPISKLLQLFSGSILKPATTGVYFVGGNVQGLRGTLVLQNNKGDDLTISVNGSFKFQTSVQDETIYSVTIKTQPTSQSCSVIDGTERVFGADVDTILVTCQTIPVRYTLGGTVSQLQSGNQIIVSNRGEDLTLSTNGSFNFNTGVIFGNNYTVSVSLQPSNQNCIVVNATARMPAFNQNNVAVICYGNSYGALVSGSIIYPLSLPSPRVTSFVGSYCNPNTVCTTGSSGYFDSISPSSVLFQDPDGIATDGYNLYVADKTNQRIRKIIISTGETTTLAGNGSTGLQDGIGTAANITSPQYITTDGYNLYVADNTNKTIRKINLTTNLVTTMITGTGGLGTILGLAVHNNILYIADNTNKTLWRLNLSTNSLTTVNTFSIALTGPKAMTVVGSDLYIIDADRILKTTVGTWSLSVFAGGSSGYVNASGTSAQFNSPTGIATDGTNLYVSDSSNHAIRKIVISTSAVTTLAGSLSSTSGYTNSSTATNALFNFPAGITSDGNAIYVVDKNNHTIRKID